jgi:hypothetical protein
LKTALHGKTSTTETLDIKELEVIAVAASVKQDHAKAIELMKKATQLEEARGAPSGPPSLIKPHRCLRNPFARGQGCEAVCSSAGAARQPPGTIVAWHNVPQRKPRSWAATSAYTKLEQWQQADGSLLKLSPRSILPKQRRGSRAFRYKLGLLQYSINGR